MCIGIQPCVRCLVRTKDMLKQSSPIANTKRSVEQVSDKAIDSPGFERLARAGHAAKGVVYMVLGALAARAAFGLGGRTTDKQGVLETILTEPFGQILLALVAVGLIGYALWRFVQAILD